MSRMFHFSYITTQCLSGLSLQTKMHFTPLKSFVILLLLLVFASNKSTARKLGKAKPGTRGSPPPVPAVLIFGDSTVDPGNNDYIWTTFRSNFWPYGKDFFNQTPTGRFTNGRLANDFIGKYIGIKDYIPPYLDPTLSIEELMTGVSFASAGSGFDPFTPTIGNVIPVGKQLEQLKEYKWRLEAAIGKEKTRELISNALFIVSAGTNDFIINYFPLPVRRLSYTLPMYMDFLLQETRKHVQGLLDEGGRRIGVVGLPPMGCLPFMITLYSDDPIGKRGCASYFSSVARDYNQMLQNELKAIQRESQPSRARIAYLDTYTPLDDMISGRKYEFEEVRSGCCGTGLLETSFLCNHKSAVCEDASKYVFWDSVHPTEKSYQLVFQSFRPVIDNLVHT